MSSAPGLPEYDIPMIFGDKMTGLGFQSGVFRVGFSANTADYTGREDLVRSGYLVLTPECALELRSHLDQLLSELQRRGMIEFSPDKLQS